VDNNKSVEEFFKSVNWSNTTTTSTTNASSIEQNELFGGDLSNIDEWIRHEEFRLKKKKEDSERNLREENAKKAFWFSSIWAIFIGIFILLHGFEQINYFRIKETEFMFVCGTLTTSILIFYLTVIRNLFPLQKNNDVK
jgi:hypothetical protein